jgi:hypothetical protein
MLEIKQFFFVTFTVLYTRIERLVSIDMIKVLVCANNPAFLEKVIDALDVLKEHKQRVLYD